MTNQNYRISILAFCSLISFAIAAIFSVIDLLWVALFFCFVGIIGIIMDYVKRYGQFFSLSLVFWIFSAIYGLSGVINIAIGGTIDSVFGEIIVENYTHIFLFAYCLASIGVIVGTTVDKCISKPMIKKNEQYINADVKFLYRGAIISALLCSLFEMLNLYRVGGIQMLFVGKGLYQSAVGDLTLTLPSEVAYGVCGMFLGLMLGNSKSTHSKVTNKIIAIIILLMPFLGCKIMLGMRGTLATAFLTGIACYTVKYPIKYISLKLVMMVLLGYFFMVFLYANRSIVSLLISSPDEFFKLSFNVNRLSTYINPGSGEFGTPLGNFCVFYDKYGTNFAKRLGKTYLEGLLVPIPSFLYIGNKPKQIAYVFRDEFFHSWASRSRIAGTGFSSILEAYVNFGFVGIVLVYFIIGILLHKADKQRCSCTNLFKVMINSALVSFCMHCSRTAFGSLWAEYVETVIIFIIVYCFSKVITYKN